MLRSRAPALTLTLALASCGGEPPFEPPPGCQPLLDGEECLLPYPSDFFLRRAPGAAPRVELTAAARLTSSRTGGPATPAPLRPRPSDGFSRLSPVALRLGGPVALDGLVKVLDDPGPTLAASSPTLIVDTGTGERVPHFVDLDDRDPDPATRVLVLRPLAPLPGGRRFVVAIRGVRGPDGALAPAPAGFSRLRDARGLEGDALRAEAARFEADVFPPLAALGVPRAELQLAFDFTTRTEADLEHDLLRVRELTLEWLDREATRVAASVRIERVTEPADGPIWRTIEGAFDAPRFVEEDAPGTRLARGADGEVEVRGTTRVRFTAKVPASVRDRFEPGHVLTYGHGFFGGRDEVDGGSAQRIADATGTVVIGIDWVGMTTQDVVAVIDDLVNQPHLTGRFVERVHQAMANWIVLTRLVSGPLAAQSAFRRPARDGAPGAPPGPDGRSSAGALVFDPAHVHFLGISQGHILGGVNAALNPALERVVLEAGGAGFTHMMARARPFAPFLVFLEQSLARPSDQLKFLLLAQEALDPIDPGNWAGRVLERPLPGQRPRRALVRLGLGDTQVPNDATWRHARALGVPAVAPLPVAGPARALPTAPAPHEGSGLAVFDFGLELGPLYARAVAPDDGTVVHEGLRVTPEGLSQLARFLADGVIENPCAPLACRVGPR